MSWLSTIHRASFITNKSPSTPNSWGKPDVARSSSGKPKFTKGFFNFRKTEPKTECVSEFNSSAKSVIFFWLRTATLIDDFLVEITASGLSPRHLSSNYGVDSRCSGGPLATDVWRRQFWTRRLPCRWAVEEVYLFLSDVFGSWLRSRKSTKTTFRVSSGLS